MLTILGGTYREVCLAPNWNKLYGSGLRAAAALIEIVEPIHLFTYASHKDRKQLSGYAESLGLGITTIARDETIEFQYDHSGGHPRLLAQRSDVKTKKPFALHENTNGDVRESVLVYSFIEATGPPTFNAKRAVYDPQAGHRARPFASKLCKVEQLGIVLNLTEARAIAFAHGITRAANKSPRQLAQAILKNEDVEVVVIKNGIFGAHVATGKHSTQHIPAMKTERYFGIGSGDIFSAVFAAYWMDWDYTPFEAAELASAATAFYCNEQGVVPLPPDIHDLVGRFESINLDRIKAGGEPKSSGLKPVYLAGPFFSLSQKWLLNQALDALQSVGLQVWSPSLEAGILSFDSSLEDVEDVVRNDLAGLESSGSVLALADQMDPGTLFEAGYALKIGLPVTVYAESVRSSDLTMFTGSGCFVTDDFASALANAVVDAYKL